jgi:hypothetical protein
MENTNTDTAQPTQAANAQPPAGLSLQDLNILAAVVDGSCKRGLIHANDMSVIGGVYDRLTAFLAAAMPAPAAPEETPAPAAPVTEE